MKLNSVVFGPTQNEHALWASGSHSGRELFSASSILTIIELEELFIGSSEHESSAMNDTTVGLGLTDDEMLDYEVSNEALETAAGADKAKSGIYKLMHICTFYDFCPSP